MSTVDNEVTGPTYPSSWRFDGLLTDGTAVCVRPIQRSDVPLLRAFHLSLSPETVYRRFLGAHPELSHDEALHFTDVDYRDRMAFVAVVAERMIGVARYDRPAHSDDDPEVAFVVADEVQNHGVATLLLESLAAYARTMGIDYFVAEVLADNVEMLQVFRASGLRCERVSDGGAVHVKIDIHPTPEYRASCDAREASAEAASVAAILRPRSIAVVGAGRHPGSVGHEIVRSLLAGDFAGTVYPVNPRARAICGVRAYSSLSSLPEIVDLAIVAVPPDAVRAEIGHAATLGVRAAVIITSGFAETGGEGRDAEEEMLAVARGAGMRIVGPNCLGVVNNDPEVRMQATFADLGSQPGRLGLVSQSGAIGMVLARQARHAGIGLSSFTSVGNKIDVSSNDLLCYFERDEQTSVIALYLESFGNPRKFARIARRVGERKPIVALTSGRTTAGARGARSHTAAAATSDVVVTALLDGAGVIKIDHLDEMIDVSSVLLSSSLPAGDRVALIGNSGGPLILAADACDAAGLVVAELGRGTQDAIAAIAGPMGAVSNPVDLTANGDAEALARTLATVLDDDQIDSVLVVVTSLPGLSCDEARVTLTAAGQTSEKPIVLCALGDDDRTGRPSCSVAEIPTPERAIAALGRVARYARWRRRSHEPVHEATGESPVVDHATVASALARYRDGAWLDLDDAAELLHSCGLPVLATPAAGSASEAVDLARAAGFPVVLKARVGSLVHKSEAGGVVVGLSTDREVSDAFRTMSERLGPHMGGAVVQSMVNGGVEAIIGATSDPLFGPVIMVGIGGVMTDLLADRAFAVPPLEEGEADRMVASLRAAPILDGFRGAPVVDRASLVRLVERVAQVVDQFPELVELDLNPVLVRDSGAIVVDCKVRLAPELPGPGPFFRSLRRRA